MVCTVCLSLWAVLAVVCWLLIAGGVACRIFVASYASASNVILAIAVEIRVAKVMVKQIRSQKR